eukprot:augustus_masked-scaffold_52-processed-gene-1.27-mRNA-1 protein AED:1.00 eAED:1.00 QI:0/-1/0/0/-1/1/1/0/540
MLKPEVEIKEKEEKGEDLPSSSAESEGQQTPGMLSSIFSGIKNYFPVPQLGHQNSLESTNMTQAWRTTLIKNLITGDEEIVLRNDEVNNKTELEINPYNTIIFVLVVIKHENKYCTTEEVGGWHLPAGPMLYGETVETAAKRIAMHEANLDIEVESFFRFEYNYSRTEIRFRCVITAVAVNPQDIKVFKEQGIGELSTDLDAFKPGKSLAAHWYNFNEVQHLVKKKAKSAAKRSLMAPTSVGYAFMTPHENSNRSIFSRKKNKKLSVVIRSGNVSVISDASKVSRRTKFTKLSKFSRNSNLSKASKQERKLRYMRNQEMYKLFKCFEGNPVRTFSPDLFLGVEGQATQNKNVSSLIFRVQLVIKTKSTNKFLILQHSATEGGVFKHGHRRYFSLPSDSMKIVLPFFDLANDLLLDYINLLEIKKIKRSKDNQEPFGELVGICGVKHIAPSTASLRAKGQLCFTYLAEVEDRAEKVVVKKRWKWLTLQELVMSYEKEKSKLKVQEEAIAVETMDILAHIEGGLVAPLYFLVPEGADYSVNR